MNSGCKALILFASIALGMVQVEAQDLPEKNPIVMVFPGAEIKPIIPYFADNLEASDWSNTIVAYADDSNLALRAWCDSIGPDSSALVVSAQTLSGAELSSCGAVGLENALMIELPASDVAASEALRLQDNISMQPLYLYMRGDVGGFSDLSGIGKVILRPYYGGSAADLFDAGKQMPNDAAFFTNICLRCGCCIEKILEIK